MSESLLTDYLDHIAQAAADARSFIEDQSKDGFLSDKRTQRAVVMSLVIVGEAATKATERYPEFVARHPEVPWHGEEIVITRRGEQVARLMPPETRNAESQARALVERIRRSRAGHALGGAASIRELIDEGRR